MFLKVKYQPAGLGEGIAMGRPETVGCGVMDGLARHPARDAIGAAGPGASWKNGKG